MRRPLGAVLAALSLLAAIPAGAAAAAPTNDDRSTPTVVTEPLPFVDAIDTSEATSDPGDGGCGGPDDLATVWYEFSPTVSDAYLATGAGSAYSTGVNVFLETPGGGLELINCVIPGATFWGEAGETYLIMVAACCEGVNGGQLLFTLDLAPPPLEIDLDVAGTATLDRSSGSVTVSGIATCDREALIGLDGRVRQRAGRIFIDGWLFTDVLCTPEGASWSAVAFPANGTFTGGKATVDVFAFSFEGDGFAEASAQVRIRK